MNLWLNSDESRFHLLRNFDMKKDTRLEIDKDLPSRLNLPTNCLGIVFRKEGGNKTATLTSWKCNAKKSFLCSLNVFQFKSPVAKAKLPCLTSKTRPKRHVENKEKNDEKVEYGRLFKKLNIS